LLGWSEDRESLLKSRKKGGAYEAKKRDTFPYKYISPLKLKIVGE
jgi:hypothetical protein